MSKGAHGLTDVQAKAVTTAVGTCQNPGCVNTAKLVVDHDHVSGALRGVLCAGCNLAAGFLSDDLSRLAGLIEYLTQPPGISPEHIPVKPPRQTASKYRGVRVYEYDRTRWRAFVWVRGALIAAGVHATELEAARAYNEKAVALLGEKAKLNKLS